MAFQTVVKSPITAQPTSQAGLPVTTPGAAEPVNPDEEETTGPSPVLLIIATLAVLGIGAALA